MKNKSQIIAASALLASFILCPAYSLAEDKKTEEPETTEGSPAEPEMKVEEVKFYDYPFICESNVSYLWVPLPPKETEEDKAKGEAVKKETVEKAKQEPITVFFTRTGSQGHIEQEVRRALAAKLEAVKKEALTFCASKHQNQATCISKGFATIRSNYRESDYFVRKALLDSIVQSCEAEFGICSGAHSSEVTCYENRPPELRPEKTKEEASDKKDKKGS